MALSLSTLPGRESRCLHCHGTTRQGPSHPEGNKKDTEHWSCAERGNGAVGVWSTVGSYSEGTRRGSVQQMGSGETLPLPAAPERRFGGEGESQALLRVTAMG